MRKRKYLSMTAVLAIVCVVSVVVFALVLLSGVGESLDDQTGLRLSPLLAHVFLIAAVAPVIHLLMIKPIANARKQYHQHMTGGDLTTRLEVARNDEFGQFARSFNAFMAQIHNIVFKLKNMIKTSHEDGESLASNTTQSAASVREITTTISSMRERENALKNQVELTRNSAQGIRDSIREITELIGDQASSMTEAA
jgi:methyl-accepting chemotaxis protein